LYAEDIEQQQQQQQQRLIIPFIALIKPILTPKTEK